MAISAAATKLVVECRISSGGAVTAYFDDVRLLPQTVPYRNRLDGPWKELQDAYKETGTEGVFYGHHVPRRHWNLYKGPDGMPWIEWARGIQEFTGEQSENFLGLASVTPDKHVRLVGSAYLTDTLAVGTNIEFDPHTIAYLAAAELVQGRISRPSEGAKYAPILQTARELRETLPQDRAMAGAVLVR